VRWGDGPMVYGNGILFGDELFWAFRVCDHLVNIMLNSGGENVIG